MVQYMASQLRAIEVTKPQTTDEQSRYARMMKAYTSLGIGSSESRI